MQNTDPIVKRLPTIIFTEKTTKIMRAREETMSKCAAQDDVTKSSSVASVAAKKNSSAQLK
jgi:hypothetical protein